jgi:hypothetical protein
MSERGDGVREARSLFNQVRGSGAVPTSPLQLEIVPVELADAKKLNRLWHSRLPRMGTGAIDNQPFPCFGATHDGTYYAAAIWSTPVARMLPQDWSGLELRRLAVAPDAPRNTPSRMLKVMAMLLRRSRPDAKRLFSYQDTEVHTGGIYKAAGWMSAGVSTAKKRWTWGCKSRSRPKEQSNAPKQCWDKCLVCAMGTNRTPVCEVCHERIPELRDRPVLPTVETGGRDRTALAGPAGETPDLPPRERGKVGSRKRDALPRPSLWDTSTEDG